MRDLSVIFFGIFFSCGEIDVVIALGGVVAITERGKEGEGERALELLVLK